MAVSEHAFKGGYSHLFFQEDVITEVQKPQEATAWKVSSGSSWGRSRWVPVCLGMLSVVLLLLDIGLGIHYGRVRDGHLPNYSNITHMSSELSALRSRYEAAVQTSGEARRRVRSETSEQARSTQLLEHCRTRTKDLKDRITFFEQEKIDLLSKLFLSEESCRRCLPGWTLVNFRCYYTLSRFSPRKPWDEARASCVRSGADLVVIDSIAKQVDISKMIKDDQRHSGQDAWLGFWMGLRRSDGGGDWQWHGDAPLVAGYWIPGEPSDRPGDPRRAHMRENCVAMHIRDALLQNWNDAECHRPNKWICEMGMTN